MAFLERNSIIHRDIAARNVLVGESAVDVKLSDLGAARNIMGDGEYVATTLHMPAKWMSLEALQSAKFSHKSDVFAFGVLLWEVTSFGKPPWGAFGVADIVDSLRNGERLQKQESAPDALYSLCLRCWSTEPKQRPSFAQVNDELQILPAIVRTSINTTDRGCIDVPGATAGSIRHASGDYTTYTTEGSDPYSGGYAREAEHGQSANVQTSSNLHDVGAPALHDGGVIVAGGSNREIGMRRENKLYQHEPITPNPAFQNDHVGSEHQSAARVLPSTPGCASDANDHVSIPASIPASLQKSGHCAEPLTTPYESTALAAPEDTAAVVRQDPSFLPVA